MHYIMSEFLSDLNVGARSRPSSLSAAWMFFSPWNLALKRETWSLLSSCWIALAIIQTSKVFLSWEAPSPPPRRSQNKKAVWAVRGTNDITGILRTGHPAGQGSPSAHGQSKDDEKEMVGGRRRKLPATEQAGSPQSWSASFEGLWLA